MSLSGPVRFQRGGTDSLAITSQCFFFSESHSILVRVLTIAFGQATLARVSALISAQSEPKPTFPKKLRGKKAKLASEGLD